MPHHARRVIAATLLTLSLLASASGSASATYPGANGQIGFMRSDAEGTFQIWVANADMANQVQITHGYGGSGFPSWSPDGTRIVFDSHRTDPDLDDSYEISDVFTMRPDGSDVRKLTDSVGFSGHPSWSPDGRWIIFDADRADYPRSRACTSFGAMVPVACGA